MFKFLSDFIVYIKSPDEFRKIETNLNYKVRAVLISFLVYIVIGSFIILITNLLLKFGILDVYNSRILKFSQSKEKSFFIILIAGIVLPVIEEFAFRLPLRIKRENFIPFILYLAPVFVFSVAGLFHFGILIRILSILILIIIGLLVLLSDFTWEKIERGLKAHFTLYFYAISILFALIHITNYQLSIKILLFTPLLVFPQFIMGLILGYLRMNFSLIWAILFHIMVNCFILVPSILHHSKPESMTGKIKESDYTFTIEDFPDYYIVKGKKYPTLTQQKVTPREILLEGSFKEIISTLTGKKQRHIEIRIPGLVKNSFKLHLKIDSTLKVRDSNLANGLALRKLKEKYKFSVKEVLQDVEGWEIKVVNNQLFMQKADTLKSFKDESPRSSFVDINDTLDLQGVNSVKLSFVIRSAYNVDVKNSIDNRFVFSVRLPNGKREELDRFLQSFYGISISKTFIKEKILIIE